jgi:hypothetical protein
LYKPDPGYYKKPLPPLEEIDRGVSIQLKKVVKHGTHSMRDLDVALRTSSIVAERFLDNPLDCEHDLALNAHLRAEGAMSPGRVPITTGSLSNMG